MNARKESRLAAVSPGRFLTLVVALSWLCWVSATQVPDGRWHWVVKVLLVAGGAMPLVVTALVVRWSIVRAEREEFLVRLADGRRITTTWWAVLLLAVPVITALASILDILTGGSGTALGAPAAAAAVQPVSLIPFLFFTLLFGPLPEEVAWRGYALDRMLNVRSALVASVWIGVVWAAWHLPLFWLPGTYQHQLGVGSAAFWLFLAEMLPRSVIMTWIFVNTSRSTLAMILFHFMVNAVGELFRTSFEGDVIRLALWVLAAVVVVWIWGYRKLGAENGEKASGSGDQPRVSE